MKKTSSKTKLNSSQSRLRWLSHNHSWRYLQLDYPCKEILSCNSPFKTRPTLKLASTIDFVLYFQLDGILYNICKVYFGKTNIQTIINPKSKECQYIQSYFSMNPCGKSYRVNGNLAISSFPSSLRIHKSKEKQTSLKMQNYKNTKLQNYKNTKSE